MALTGTCERWVSFLVDRGGPAEAPRGGTRKSLQDGWVGQRAIRARTCCSRQHVLLTFSDVSRAQAPYSCRSPPPRYGPPVRLDEDLLKGCGSTSSSSWDEGRGSAAAAALLLKTLTLGTACATSRPPAPPQGRTAARRQAFGYVPQAYPADNGKKNRAQGRF